MKSIKQTIWSILNFLKIGGLVQIMLKSYIKDSGWLNSFHTKRSVDANGNPLPWVTYPFIHFIEERLNTGMALFEYGSGNSSRWYAKNVGTVTAVEHDEEWYKLVKNQIPANASVVYRSLDGVAYEEEVFSAKKLYDLVIVDGRKRVNCVKCAYKSIAENGVIVLDNSDRPSYQEAHDFMKGKGFKKIDFWGLSPITAHLCCTTVFYRGNNCLGI
jgi:precorrin-6B methylase 2